MKTHIAAGTLFIAVALLQSTDLLAQRHRSHEAYTDRRDDHRPYKAYYRSYPHQSAGVSIIAALPFGSVRVSIGGRPYQYYQGIFYRPEEQGYLIAPPPVGIIVPSLPPGSVAVVLGGRRCYYFSDTYYMPVDDTRYQVIEAPETNNAVAAKEAASADAVYEKIVIDGKTYYKKGDTYYKALVDDTGAIAYEAVGQAAK